MMHFAKKLSLIFFCNLSLSYVISVMVMIESRRYSVLVQMATVTVMTKEIIKLWQKVPQPPQCFL